MYTNDDIYTGSVDPNNRINPKILGAFYINTKTAKLFVCTDNTFNKNVWKMCNPDIKMPEIPPSVFTTCNSYSVNNGPYKNRVTYTNTENKPICIILYANFYGGHENDITLYIDNSSFTAADDWHHAITGIIPHGSTFAISAHVSWVGYYVIK